MKPTAITTSALLTAETADDAAVFALLEQCDRAVDASPHPNDATSKNAAVRAVDARNRLQQARDAACWAWGDLKRRRSQRDSLRGRLMDAERHLVLARQAEDAAVASGRLAPTEKRHFVLMRSHIEDVTMSCHGEVTRLTVLVAKHEAAAASSAEHFDAAVRHVDLTLHSTVREVGIGRDGKPTLQPAEGM